MRSDAVKRGTHRAPHRSLLRATGQIAEDRDFDKPFIAVCNSYVDIIPGHLHLQAIGEFVKQCVREAGGVPFLFNTTAWTTASPWAMSAWSTPCPAGS